MLSTNGCEIVSNVLAKQIHGYAYETSQFYWYSGYCFDVKQTTLDVIFILTKIGFELV